MWMYTARSIASKDPCALRVMEEVTEVESKLFT